jgi:hypothetical protein
MSAMDPLRTDVARSFSVGGVLALTGHVISRHFLFLSVASIAAGAAAVLLPVGSVLLWPQFTWLAAHPLIRELIQTALAIVTMAPALVLVLRSLAGESVGLWAIAAASARRIPAIVFCQVVVDFVIVAPVYFLGLSLTVTLTVYLVYEIPLLAFNYVFWAVLAAESIGPLQAVRRTFGLLAGRWWRMCLLALILWAASMLLVFALQFSGLALGFGWGQIAIAILSFGLRLFVVIPLAAAAYRSLVQEKDGLEHAVRVFD